MEVSPLLSEEEIKRGKNRRELDRLRKEYIESKGYNVVEQWECKWKEQFIKNSTVKNYIRENFPYKRPLSENSLLQQIRNGTLFGYVQCD